MLCTIAGKVRRTDEGGATNQRRQRLRERSPELLPKWKISTNNTEEISPQPSSEQSILMGTK